MMLNFTYMFIYDGEFSFLVCDIVPRRLLGAGRIMQSSLSVCLSVCL